MEGILINGVAPLDDLPTLSDRGLRELAGLVRAYSGITLGPDKHQLVANRLRRRVRELKLESFEHYGEYVRADGSGSELETLVDLMSTNHTAFFRESLHFAALVSEVLPRLRAARGMNRDPLRVWSAACATGEEAYTLAMLLAEDSAAEPGRVFELLGSDISRRALALAERGVYPMERAGVVPEDLLKRYFERGVGAQAGRCRVKRILRDAVRFQRINLLDDSYPLSRPQDVIFCRNVLIYFDVETRRRVLARLAASLTPEGVLVVGVSESVGGLLPELVRISHGVYARP
mgnify:CR=1 FL=1